MPTTYEKLGELVDTLRTTDPGTVSEEARGLVEMSQLAEGMGVDVWGAIMPDTPAEADVMVDGLLCLLLQLRGDDLPPFDPSRYGELEPGNGDGAGG